MKDPNYSSFIRFKCILHDSAVLLSVFENSLKVKRRNLIPCCEPILQNGWIIWSLLLCFKTKHINDSNSLSFIIFYWILHDSAVVLSVFENVLKLKRGDLISWEEKILQNGWITWSTFCISILNIWRILLLPHFLDFNAFYMIQQ